MSSFIDSLSNLLTKLLGTSVIKGSQQPYTEGGIFNRNVGSPSSDYVNQMGGNLTSNYSAPSPTPTPTPVFDYGQGNKPPIPQQYRQPIIEGSQAQGFDPSMVGSQIAQEAGGYGYEPRVGSSGERGITQIIPDIWWNQPFTGASSAEEYGARLDADPLYAIQQLISILGYLRSKVGNEPQDILGAYNAGEGNYQAGYPYAQEVLGRIGMGVNQ